MATPIKRIENINKKYEEIRFNMDGAEFGNFDKRWFDTLKYEINQLGNIIKEGLEEGKQWASRSDT